MVIKQRVNNIKVKLQIFLELFKMLLVNTYAEASYVNIT